MNNREHERRPSTLLQTEMPLKVSLPVTVAIMALLIAAVLFFNIPNPNMILIAGLVVSSALFGYSGGITAGIIMFLYTLYFFSTDNSFVSFTTQNIQKVVVSLVGILADMFFVCGLKRREMAAFRQIRSLTEELSVDNTKLQKASTTDALTGVRNRYALRNDYSGYFHHNVHVIMLDIDNFKLINDSHGHDTGDRVLQETGQLLSELFGSEHCYRYGGDEFLIIVPDAGEAEIMRRLDALQNRRPLVNGTPVGYSVGCTHGLIREQDDLREMFTDADERMYAAKHDDHRGTAGA